MARKCELTGRKTVAGKSRRHQRGKAGGVSGPWSRKAPATNRTFKPNLVKVQVLVDGKSQRMKISHKAYKRLRKFGHLGNVTLNLSRKAEKTK